MTVSAESQKSIDVYLATLRKRLSDLKDDDIRDIVEEIRAHILDKTSPSDSPESVAATLAALGPPEKLALRYRTEELLQRARRSRSLGMSLRAGLRWSALSLSGLLVFLISAEGYGAGAFLIWLGSMKAIHPNKTSVDLEFNQHTWAASFQSGGPPRGHDPFGLWLAPLGILGGGLILWLSFRLSSWGMRKLRRPRPLPSPLAVEE
ncbi:MAG TPA: hypothetical protein VL990_03305 [Acidobacteriaceae bacterium]|nr:hypothetical protein [Acidobacteriaceae bacterium]